MSVKRIAPSDNKFHKGAKNGKHYWLTPPDLMKALDAEFHFDHDPCPFPQGERDGLTEEWGAKNYVNPPFGSIMHQGKRKGITAWIRKAMEERDKGKTVVLVYPLDKWVLMMLKAGAEIRNLGDVRWHSTEDGEAGPGTGRHIACFVLRPPCDHLACAEGGKAMKAGAVERIAQYMEAYEGYQGDYSLTVGKRILAAIFEEGKP